MESREALEHALSEFPGALLLVSHDRALLDAVGTRTIALEQGRLHSYMGGWPEYLRVREARARAASAKPTATRKRARSQPQRKRPATGERDQASLEREIEQAESKLRVLEDELADPTAWSTPEKTAEHAARHEQAKQALEELYRRWEETAV
jgi:ATP-binding cassette, subfamily F, member 3